jgi:aryl-alcohol dehydrogenase-like predicted oxidoreductase
MDKILQTGLSAGMSATAGFHSSKPTRVSEELNGKNIKDASFCPDAKARVSFPTSKGNPVEASYVCIGAWPWGDVGTWSYSDEEIPAIREAWKMLYEAGINFIDTAEAYGNGKSEKLVGEMVAGLPRDSYVIQTKYFGAPFQASNYIHPVDAPVRALRGCLERLGLEYVDIYLVHGPIHPQSIATLARGIAKCVEEGLTRTVGVANYDPDDVEKMSEELAKHGVKLATNQCEFNLLRRYPEVHGNIATCEKKGMIFQGYSSLAQGKLTGKYTVDNPPPKAYKFSNYKMEDIEPTLEVLRRIASARGKSIAAVALNYNISKGVLPVVGIRKPEQAKDAIEALGWRLSEQDMIELDKVSMEGQKTVLWQQG